MPALLDAYIAGVAEAAAEYEDVCLLLGGATRPSEIVEFAERAAARGLRAGAVLQNAAVLARPYEILATGATLWIDLAELNRTVCGRPPEQLPATELEIIPLVADLLVGLVGAGGTGVGIDLSGIADADVVGAALYANGFRTFATARGRVEALRLVLGQAALPIGTFEH